VKQVYTNLYDRRKPSSSRKHRSPVELDFEKNKKDCTFSPNFVSEDYYKRKIAGRILSPKMRDI